MEIMRTNFALAINISCLHHVQSFNEEKNVSTPKMMTDI